MKYEKKMSRNGKIYWKIVRDEEYKKRKAIKGEWMCETGIKEIREAYKESKMCEVY